MQGKTMVVLQGLQNDKISEILNDNATKTSQEVISNTTKDNVWQLIGLILLLIIILIAAYYTSKFVGGIKLGQLKYSNFKIVDTYRISPNKAMQIVQVGNKFIVIAIGKDTIQYITELDESEVQLKEIKTENNLNFKQILDKVRNK